MTGKASISATDTTDTTEHRPSCVLVISISAGSMTDTTEHRPSTATTTVTEPDIRPVNDDGDHDRFAHYTQRADANRAYVEGTPVRALCGKVWIPSRDPSRYPVCPECAKIRERLRKRAFN